MGNALLLLRVAVCRVCPRHLRVGRLALSMLFAAPVFGTGRLEKTVRVLMIASGVLSLAGLIGVPLADMGIRNIGIQGYARVGLVVSPAPGSSSGAPGRHRKRPGDTGARSGRCRPGRFTDRVSRSIFRHPLVWVRTGRELS